jgi:hypothetical protein
VPVPGHARPWAAPGLKAAAGEALTENLEAAHGLGKALEPGRPKLAQFEQLAQEPACAIRDHHGAKRGRLLQPRRQVRRLAHHRLLARHTLADEIAHDHQAGGDANPCRERLSGWGGEPADCRDDGQTGLHCALGVVLVREGPAKVGQHAIAHQLGHVSADARDLARDGVLIGVQNHAHVLRVEAGRECSGAGQVGEHHRELPALG